MSAHEAIYDEPRYGTDDRYHVACACGWADRARDCDAAEEAMDAHLGDVVTEGDSPTPSSACSCSCASTVEELERENERLTRVVASVRSKTALDVVAEKMTAQDERDAALASVAELREALEREQQLRAYVRHNETCTLSISRSILKKPEWCSCGLTEVIESVPALASSPPGGKEAMRRVDP